MITICSDIMSIPVNSTPVLQSVKTFPTKILYIAPICGLQKSKEGGIVRNICDYKNLDDLITPSKLEVKQFIENFVFDKVFYFRVGETDHRSWILFVQVGDLYIYYDCKLEYDPSYDDFGNHRIHYSKNMDTILEKIP